MSANDNVFDVPTTVRELLEVAVARLAAVDNARLDAELLLAAAVGERRGWLHAWPDATVDSEAITGFLAALERRAAGEPLAYLTGQREFWSLELEVTSATLVPRSDTETLVARVLKLLAGGATVLELGTGSGAIALALARERPDARIVATDVSAAALAVAQRNANRHGLHDVAFVRCNWLLGLRDDCADVIVSNPPYIAAGDPHLDGDGVRYEPRSALVAGPHGLDAITRIVDDAPRCLRPGGWLALEHGHDQAQSVHQLMRVRGYTDVVTHCDDNSCDRVTVASRC